MSRRILARTETVINVIARTIGYTGMGVLVAMMLLTVADVFMRYVFNRPILGTTEITQFMMVTLAFFMAVWCTMLKAHIKVDLMSKYIPPMAQTISESIYIFLGLGLYSLISWQIFLTAGDKRLIGQLSEILDIPVYPFYLMAAIACGIVALMLLMHMVQDIVQAMKR